MRMVMVVVILGLKEFRLDVENAVEIEGVASEHFVECNLGALGLVHLGVRIECCGCALPLPEALRRRRDRSCLIRITSANAIWFFASGASLSRSLSHLASATVTTASSRGSAPDISSTKQVCATGAGSARPVVSTMMASNLPFLRISPSRMRTQVAAHGAADAAVIHLEYLFRRRRRRGRCRCRSRRTR